MIFVQINAKFIPKTHHCLLHCNTSYILLLFGLKYMQFTLFDHFQVWNNFPAAFFKITQICSKLNSLSNTINVAEFINNFATENSWISYRVKIGHYFINSSEQSELIAVNQSGTWYTFNCRPKNKFVFQILYTALFCKTNRNRRIIISFSFKICQLYLQCIIIGS